MRCVQSFLAVGALLLTTSAASAQDWVGYSYLAGWNSQPVAASGGSLAPVAYQQPAATPVAYTLGGGGGGCGCAAQSNCGCASACNSGCASGCNSGCNTCNSCCGGGMSYASGGYAGDGGGGGTGGPGIFDAGIGGVAYAPGSALAAAGGYIDSAVVRNFLRLRFDAAYDGTFPDRALFNYPAVLGESSIDFQDISAYLELALTDRLSGFVEVPYRFLNPTVLDNTAGFYDLQTGFRYALVADCDRFITFQLKIYVPTGDDDRGIGTGHASIEPGLLYHNRIGDGPWSIDGELKLWVPISDVQGDPGTGPENFAGPVARYGLGVGYDIFENRCKNRRLTGVAEFVGWTVIDGLKSDPGGVVLDASGDTIVNGKFGLRYTAGQHTFYAGYAKAFTGHVWYDELIRAEYGIAF